jgi:hypothetical protein
VTMARSGFPWMDGQVLRCWYLGLCSWRAQRSSEDGVAVHMMNVLVEDDECEVVAF